MPNGVSSFNLKQRKDLKLLFEALDAKDIENLPLKKVFMSENKLDLFLEGTKLKPLFKESTRINKKGQRGVFLLKKYVVRV